MGGRKVVGSFGRFFRREVQRYWRLDLVAFCLLIVMSVPIRTAMLQSSRGGLIVTLILEPVALFIVLVLRPVFLRLRLQSTSTIRSICWAALLCIGAALVETAWAKFVTNMTGWLVPTWSSTQAWLAPGAYYVVVFAGWGMASSWVAAETERRQEQRRANAAETEALKAELLQLRMQIDPHFLFNALNGIAAEIPEDPKAAAAMVRELAAFLRYSLDHRNKTIAPLIEEIEALKAYLKVQQARFGDKIQYDISVSAAALEREAPSFLLQPLVENAVKHGFRAGYTPLRITIAAEVVGDTLRVAITNSGRLSDGKGGVAGSGVGLTNIRRRLVLHYPDRHSFALSESGETVRAELTMEGRPWSA